MKKQKLFGKLTPYAWVLEATRGCNLRCGHCSCRLDPLPKQYQFMSVETAEQAARIFAKVNPTARLDICGTGEPTLNPDLLAIIRAVRRIAPVMQIQVTTNGTMLAAGKVRYGDLLDAGANFVYTDMYSPVEKFKLLAAEVEGAQCYEYYKPLAGAPSPWTYHGKPGLRVVVLQENPANWPKSRKTANLLGTWFNHLDWEAAGKFGMKPILSAPDRRCNQPFVYTLVDAGGNYLLCGQDGAHETAGQLGNVAAGLEGYKEFWFSPFMQLVRRNLRNKNRDGNPHCCRCAVTFSRCDYVHWKDEDHDKYYRGGEWVTLTEADSVRYKNSVRGLRETIDSTTGLPILAWGGFDAPAADEPEARPIRVEAGSGMREDFCAFILTHGRPDRVHTYGMLDRYGYTGKTYIVIDDEDATGDEYRRRFGDKVLMFSKAEIAKTFDEGDNFKDRRSIVYARNAAFNLARQVGCRFFIQLDDDYHAVIYRFDGQAYYGNWRVDSLDWMFTRLCEYLELTPFASVAIAQGGDYIGGGEGKKAIGAKRKAMNTFVCDVEKPFTFIGRINEDVNTYTCKQRAGLAFLSFMQVHIIQSLTQNNSGGMTEIYLDTGTYVKSFYSVMFAPSCVKIGMMGRCNRRLHHRVLWNATAPKIVREIYKKE